MLTELKCRNCGSPLKTEDISPQISAARCSHCGSIFALPVAGGEKKYARPEVSLPKRIQIEERMDGLTITRRWMTHSIWILLFFTVVWNGFMVMWNGMALSRGDGRMALFSILHVSIGIFLIYMVLATFLNTTKVIVSGDFVTVRIGPLPWLGNKRLMKGELEQLYCTERVKHSKNGPSVTYQVEVILIGNRRETLIKGLKSYDQALFIEQQLEKNLSISDIPVSGEYGC